MQIASRPLATRPTIATATSRSCLTWTRDACSTQRSPQSNANSASKPASPAQPAAVTAGSATRCAC
jgi:hypothetical protein